MASAARRSCCLAIGVVVAIAASGCALHDSRSGTPTSSAVRVVESDFRITAPTHVESGDVLLSVRNKGPDAHELLVVRTDGPLPLRPDGTTVDEDAIDPELAGVLEPGEPGSTRVLRVHLAPGHYRFFCNMAGHFLGGMDAGFVVE
jgi:uncharacterized cupredoxin-like copper-binding protein